MTKLRWEKNFFSDTYKLYNDDNLVGSIKENSFFSISHGELNDKKYSFKTIGSFKRRTEIIDDNTGKNVGEITYNDWLSRACIKVDDKLYNWKTDNFWGSKWSLSNSENVKISYSESNPQNEIEFTDEEEMLILSGLFIKNYYLQILLIIVLFVVIIL